MCNLYISLNYSQPYGQLQTCVYQEIELRIKDEQW